MVCSVDGLKFIVVGRRLNNNHTLLGFKIRGHRIFPHNSYRKSHFVGTGIHRSDSHDNHKNWYHGPRD